jgi:hypothetical protein
VFSSACCLAYFESTANHPFLDMIHIWPYSKTCGTWLWHQFFIIVYLRWK